MPMGQLKAMWKLHNLVAFAWCGIPLDRANEDMISILLDQMSNIIFIKGKL